MVDPKKIKIALIETGMTQIEFAEKIGVSKAHLNESINKGVNLQLQEILEAFINYGVILKYIPKDVNKKRSVIAKREYYYEKMTPQEAEDFLGRKRYAKLLREGHLNYRNILFEFEGEYLPPSERYPGIYGVKNGDAK